VRHFAREAPATAFFLVLWVAVFAAMAYQQGGLQAGGDIVTTGIRPSTGNLFGSQTWAQLAQGQLWRALTATCIHYSIIHLLGNMWVMYQIGPLVEGWYGSRLFLGLCVGIGWLGNLVAGASKHWLGEALSGRVKIPDYPSGGASGLICGLIALVAVVGWRSRTRFGDFIRGQMVAFLAYVAIMGVVLPNIDNFGHAGGALVGAAAGFLHRPMVRSARSRWATLASVAGVVALAGCGWAQYRSARAEPPAQANPPLLSLNQLGVIDVLYQTLATGTPPGRRAASDPQQGTEPPRAALVANLQRAFSRLEAIPMTLRSPEETAAFQAVGEAIRGLGAKRPAPGEIVAFRRNLAILLRRAFQDAYTSSPPQTLPPGAKTDPRRPGEAPVNPPAHKPDGRRAASGDGTDRPAAPR
jgi:membrane associated rhomboid family serine protease